MTPTENIISDIRAFNRFYTSVVGLLDKHILESPYSLSEARVLFEINKLHPCTAKQVKDAMHIDEGYLSRIIDKFIKRGLVKKSKSPTDGRVYFLSLTEEGRIAFAELDSASATEVASLLRNLSSDEKEQLAHHLKCVQLTLSKTLQAK